VAALGAPIDQKPRNLRRPCMVDLCINVPDVNAHVSGAVLLLAAEDVHAEPLLAIRETDVQIGIATTADPSKML
jgi:hypothetical protein